MIQIGKIKLAVVVSHPIQHFCPQYASWTNIEKLSVKVFFASQQGLKKYKDEKFQREISWGNLYLNEFDHEFLNGDLVLPSTHSIDAENLEERLRDFNPDVLIIYGYIQRLQRRAYYWAVEQGVKIIYISDSEVTGRKSFVRDNIKKLFLRNYFKKVSAFLTVGDSNELYYHQNGVALNKLFRSYFPIDVKTFENALSQKSMLKADLIQHFKLNQHDFVLSTVGKLISIKRHQDVIKALMLLDDYTEKRLIYFIIGDGPQMNLLRDLANQLSFHKVIFAGFTAPEKLPALYITTDLYIHPSSFEPHSLAISEAIFTGCPVIVSSASGSYGPTDDVQIGVNGFVYPVGDHVCLAKMIEGLIRDPELINMLSNNSRSIAKQHQILAHGQGLMGALNNFQLK